MKRPTFRLLTLCLSACCALTPAMAQDSFPSKTNAVTPFFSSLAIARFNNDACPDEFPPTLHR